MSGEGHILGARWPSARNPYDICACGDYRRDHEGGTGPCTFPADNVAGHEPCRGFRLQTRSKAGAAA